MAIVEQIETAGGGRRRLGLSNPATLEAVGAIDVQTAADVAGAVERARKAQPAWAELGIPARARYLERAVRVLLARQEDFIDVICAETGKPRLEALATEILTACDALQFYAKRARRILADRTRARAPAQDQEAQALLPAARRGRDHHALELPVHPVAESDRAGAGRRQRRRAQALRGDALLGTARRAALPGGGAAGRRLPAGAGRRRDRRRAGRGGDRQAELHGQRRARAARSRRSAGAA